MYDFVERISETYILPAILGIIILMWVVDLIYKPYGKKPRKASKLEKGNIIVKVDSKLFN